jgi:enamine deaminase RidA (YjgF/YER057c/UK114 family)
MARRRTIDLEGIAHNAPIPMAAVIENLLATSAIFGADRRTGQIPESAEDEIACLFDNIRALLDAAGGSCDDILRMGVLLRETSLRKIVNENWLAMFPDEADRPARHITVVADLPVRAQIELLAVLPSEPTGGSNV